MSDELKKGLADALEEKPKLDAAMETMHVRITDFEKTLTAFRFGVIAKVTLEINENFTRELRWAKEQNQWRLLIATIRKDEESVEPLTHAPRSQRLRAVKMLPALVRNFVDSLKEEISQVQQRNDDLARMIAIMKEVQSAGSPEASRK